MNELDLKKQISLFVNGLDQPFHCKFGSLLKGDSLAINEVAGGQTIRLYMDGAKDKQLNYEFSCKSQDYEIMEAALNKIAIAIDDLDELPSQNGSYDFGNIETTSMPFPSAKDESGYFIYRLIIQAKITTMKEEEE